MDNDKLPGNDGITEKLYIKFYKVVMSIQQSFIIGELSTCQKQAIISLIKKKKEIKGLLKTGKLSLNVCMKLISKVLASRLKCVISLIVNKNQVACVNNRFISKSGRLISDVVNITNSLDIEGLFPAGNYLLKFNNRNIRARCEICSKLTIKTPEQRQICSMLNFEHVIVGWGNDSRNRKSL